MARIFICYSHRDEKWKNQVVTQLRVGRDEDPTDVWCDDELRAGDSWQLRIREAIAAADVAVILISENSLTSDFILRREVVAILDQSSRRGLRIMPLILTECDWPSVSWLRELQVVPRDGKALQTKTEAEINKELAALTALIRTSGHVAIEKTSAEDAWMTGAGVGEAWRPPAGSDSYEALFVSPSFRGPSTAADRQETLRRTISDLQTNSPDLADMIRRCAIPRVLDAVILGVVRDRPDDHDGNAALLRRLVDYSFVLPRRGGGFDYAPQVRSLLLAELRADAETFESINRSLAEFYWRIYARSHGADGIEAAEPFPVAISSAFVVRTGVGEGLTVAPLPEAFYHLGLVSTGAVFDFFAEHFDAALDSDQFMICEALIEAARVTLTRIGQADETLDRVALSEARFLRRTQRTQRAIGRLRDLLSTTERPLTADFRQAVLTELGDSFLDADDVKRSADSFNAALRIAEGPHARDEQRANAIFNLATFFWGKSRFERALSGYREVIQLVGEGDLGVYARANASGVLDAVGRAEEARMMALDALHLARTVHRRNRRIADTVARRLMWLAGTREPALIDTLFSEVEALRSPASARVRLDSRCDYASALRYGGRLARAAAELLDIAREAPKHPDPRFVTQLLLQTSLVRIDERRLEEGIDICSEALSRVREKKGGLAEEAMARINRAMTTVERIRAGSVAGETADVHWSYVADDAKRAKEIYAQLDEPGWATVSAAIEHLAEAAVRGASQRPDDEARADTEENIRTQLLPAPESLAAYHMVRGDLESARERWTSAAAYYRRASGDFDSIDRLGEAAQALELSAAMAERAGRPQIAAEARRDVARRRWQLAAIDRYQPTDAAKRADAQNEAGISAMYRDDGDEVENLTRACESFRAACTEASTVTWFYRLNLAYAYAALERWDQAADALEESLKSAPSWWRAPTLQEALAGLQDRYLTAMIRQGESHFRDGRPTEATAAFAAATEARGRWQRGGAIELELRSRLALVELQHGELQRAAASLTTVLDEHRRAHGEIAGVADGWRSMMGGLAHYRLLTSRLDEAASTVENAGTRRDIRAVRQVLSSCLDALCDLRPRPSSEALLDFRPIILELGSALVPADTSVTGWNIFTDYIPAFTRRIQETIGVRVPGVLVRKSYTLADGEYMILVDEARVGGGETFPDRRYVVLDTDLTRDHDAFPQGIPAVHPGSGREGLWVLPADLDGAVTGSAPSLEPIAFAVEHLEVVARAHLATLVGLQEIDTLIDKWPLQVECSEPRARDALVRVVRALLREEVPVNQPDEILSVVLGDPDAPTDILVQRIRTRLKPVLPGNGPGDHREPLPERWEEALRPALTSDEGEPGTGITPEAAHMIVSGLGEWIGAQPANTAIVVRQAEMRPLLRRLLAAEFPRVHVLARDELSEALSTLPRPAGLPTA